MTLAGQIKALLTRDERRKAVVLLLLMVIGMALETLGIGVVIPALTLLLEPDIAAKYPQARPILDWLGNPTQARLVTVGMVALVGIYLVKTLFLALMTWRQQKFAFDVQAHLSQKVFATYLRQPYAFHLQRNSAQLIRNAITEVAHFTGNGITPGLIVITETLVLIGVGTLLLVIEPTGAIVVVLALGGAAWLFHRATRSPVNRWAVARQYHDGQRIQHLQQGLGGVKDVKLLGREDEFLDEYRVHNVRSAGVAQRVGTLGQMPRLGLELLAVMGLAILVLTMVVRGRDLVNIMPILGVFAVAAFRLMPSVNRVIGALQLIRYSVPSIAILNEELKLPVPEPVRGEIKRFGFEERIELRNVTFTYPSAMRSVLVDLSVCIEKGESVGFVGPSGSGKSTLIDVMLGLLAPSEGCVLVDGKDIQRDLRSWQDRIGYVPQAIYLTDDTLRRNVAFGLSERSIDDEAVDRAIRAAQLAEFVASLPDGLQTVVGERGVRLSGGQRQRIGIARALYHDPDVLVLDEATSALDLAAERDVMGAVNALHGIKTIVIVAHRLATVEHCERLYRLENGRIARAGAPAEMLHV